MERIGVERSKGLSFTVSARPDGWFVEKPQQFNAGPSAIDDILWDLEDMTAAKFVADSPDEAKVRELGLAVPQVAITIHLRKQDPIKVLIGNKTSEGNYYAMTSEGSQIVEVSQFLMNDLPETVEDLKSSGPDLGAGQPQAPVSGGAPPAPQGVIR